MKLYLIRHGHVHNPNEIHYGRLPRFALSKQGIMQVEKTADMLKGEKIGVLYSSPLLRARQTARILGETLELPIHYDKRLIEVQFIHEGRPRAEFEQVEQEIYKDHFIEKGQESIDQIQKRMLGFIEMLKKRHAHETIAAVSHGDPIMIMRAFFENTPFTTDYKYREYIQPGSLIEINL